MSQIQIGQTYECEIIVTDALTAKDVGSGDIAVFSTPMMVALMEKASAKCLAQFLDGDKTSVGTKLDISHLAATPVGMKVTAKAKITQVDNRRIVFDVTAFDEVELIGKGTHERFIIDTEKFINKTYNKGTK